MNALRAIGPFHVAITRSSIRPANGRANSATLLQACLCSKPYLSRPPLHPVPSLWTEPRRRYRPVQVQRLPASGLQRRVRGWPRELGTLLTSRMRHCTVGAEGLHFGETDRLKPAGRQMDGALQQHASLGLASCQGSSPVPDLYTIRWKSCMTSRARCHIQATLGRGSRGVFAVYFSDFSTTPPGAVFL